MKHFQKPRSGGRHRAPSTTAVATVSFAAVVVATFGGAGFAVAAPGDQPGVTSEVPVPSQPGVTTPAPSAPEPTPVQTWVPAPVEYQQPAQPLPNWDYNTNEYTPQTNSNDNYVAPVDYTSIHLPTQLETFTAPIQAPEDKIRFGRYLADRPNWISKETADKTNGQTAVIEAQVTDFWRSTLIIEDTEAARLAASQVGGAAAGALAGATAAAVPAATVGALIGGTIGGTSALTLFAPIVTPIGAVPAGVVGTATGAGIGAAVLGVPAAIGGAVVGGAGGALAASAYGAGDLGQPIDFEIPDIDQPAITEQTETTLDQWSANPPVGTAAADAVRNTAAAVPVADQQIRDAVTSLPGGEGAVAAFDQAVTDFQANTAVPGLPLGMIADAIGAGIPA
ncbi:insoluble domain protein (plasmid) [Rhodococcus qingshengii]|uniref:insoluble domain protein n=1 Tax=Rhodococcus qingshengii TaxID=334542 RepID=UPI001E3512CB|nr:insoluble domain protein [Rhodococcus qingshengii]UGQ55198.1 insoluble domain protein [Rhodococcus qingshengii]